jgi:hypothetical protein
LVIWLCAGLRNYIRLMEECWDQDPYRRPTFDRIAARLKAIMRWHKAFNKCRLQIPTRHAPADPRGSAEAEAAAAAVPTSADTAAAAADAANMAKAASAGGSLSAADRGDDAVAAAAAEDAEHGQTPVPFHAYAGQVPFDPIAASYVERSLSVFAAFEAGHVQPDNLSDAPGSWPGSSSSGERSNAASEAQQQQQQQAAPSPPAVATSALVMHPSVDAGAADAGGSIRQHDMSYSDTEAARAAELAASCRFELLQMLGPHVLLARTIASSASSRSTRVAILQLSRSRLQQQKEQLPQLLQLLQAAHALQHPHVVRLHEVLLSCEHLNLVTDYCSAGGLLGYVKQRGALSEPFARWFFQQLVLGVDYCHSKGVAGLNLQETQLQVSVEPTLQAEQRVAYHRLLAASGTALTVICCLPLLLILQYVCAALKGLTVALLHSLLLTHGHGCSHCRLFQTCHSQW